MKDILKMFNMKKSVILALFLIFLLGFILKTLYLSEGALIFGYDQARDAFVTQQILEGDFKILGPPASTPGLYHGVFYYYFLAPAYLLGQGNPIWGAYWVALFNSATVFLIYFFTEKLIKNKPFAIIAAILFAVSFEASQYALWLSNPTIGVWSVPLIYLGLWLWLKYGNKWAPIFSGVGLGLSIQADVFLAYHLLPLIFWLIVDRKNLGIKELSKFIIGLFASVVTMIVVEIKFGFKGIGGILNLFSREDTFVKGTGLSVLAERYFFQIGKVFSTNLFGSMDDIGKIFFPLVVFWTIYNWYKTKKRKVLSWQIFLLTYILSHSIAVPFGGTTTPFIAVGIGVGIVILVSCLLSTVWPKNKILVIGTIIIIIVLNINKIYRENINGQTIFSIQKDMLLSNELKALDYIYNETDGQSFSINTLTSPLWINTTWSYFFNWYGKSKYGYLPSWRGRDQVGQLGNNLADAPSDVSLHFYIIEPPQGLPKLYLESEPAFEESRSKLISEMKFGELQVQKREIIK